MKHTILIIGAGPAGAVAAALLCQRGYRALVIEKQHFPRFSIGESLLPQCMAFLDEAGLLPAVKTAAPQLGFQYKNGAAFKRGDSYTDFSFEDKFTAGWGWTWQVRRADFDKLLADGAAAQGAEIRYGHEILAFDNSGTAPVVTIRDADGRTYVENPAFVLDASGFGRILPRLLKIEAPSNFPMRRAIFTHVIDRIGDPGFDRDKIRVTIHQHDHRVWWWLIPFSDGRSSVGVVAHEEYFADYPGSSEQRWRAILSEDKALASLLADAEVCQEVRELGGYAANVTALYGRGFALLGNAGEFLDPVFSSGVTIAMKSASLCVPLVDRQLRGESVDWNADYEHALRRGIRVFRAYVEAWYDGGFQSIIFSPLHTPRIRSMICSILAGYVWDESNPFNLDAQRRLASIREICRPAAHGARVRMSQPDILQLIPHQLPMALLDELIDHGPGHVRARMRVTNGKPFVDAAGRFPAWAGIELMRQAIAAFGGLESRACGQPVRIGFLLGTRRYHSECAAFPPGTELIVTVHELLMDEHGLGAFECRIESAVGNIVANVNVYQPADPAVLLMQGAG